MRLLVVGDPHGRAQDVDELRVLLDFVHEKAVSNQCNVLFLGDLMHTFSIMHVDVVAEWSRFFAKNESFRSLCLVGNHDYAGQDGGEDALRAFDWSACTIRSRSAPTHFGQAYFMPFHRDLAEFERQCREIPAGYVLFCHQSFNGAKFENGFYDPHGADPQCVAHLAAVVSGHVHTRQQVANIWYPGSPRQLSFADAGEEKKIFLVDVEQGGIKIVQEIPTPCSKYYTIEAPSIPVLLEAMGQHHPDPNGHYSVKARGTPAEIAAFWSNDRYKAVEDPVPPPGGQLAHRPRRKVPDTWRDERAGEVR
jgi:DNA repair exonuclease SbcCD nuclease subunit